MWVSGQLPRSRNTHRKFSLLLQHIPPHPLQHPPQAPPPPFLSFKGFSVWGHPLTFPLERTTPAKEVIQGFAAQAANDMKNFTLQFFFHFPP